MKHTWTVLLAAVLLLGGCSRVSRIEDGSAARQAPTVTPTAAPTAAPAAAPAENLPWYKADFEALGFVVFPTPIDVPAFEVQPRAGGAPVGPADFKGKITLLNFWATWCPPCREEMPSIEILSKELKGEAFAVAAVSVKETPGTVDAFLKEYSYSFPIYLDPSGAASSNFVTRGIPTTFVLDKEGRAIAAIIGSRSYAEPEVIGLFRDLARR